MPLCKSEAHVCPEDFELQLRSDTSVRTVLQQAQPCRQTAPGVFLFSCHAAIKHSLSQKKLPYAFPSAVNRGLASPPEGLRARLKRVTERFTTVALWQRRRRKMAATLVAARGAGPTPAWGPQALTPDWENREVSTGVRKDSGFRRCARVSMRC